MLIYGKLVGCKIYVNQAQDPPPAKLRRPRIGASPSAWLMPSLWCGLDSWSGVWSCFIWFMLKSSARGPVENGINTVESPAPPTLFKRPTRQTASQTEWSDLEFHVAHFPRRARCREKRPCLWMCWRSSQSISSTWWTKATLLQRGCSDSLPSFMLKAKP